jgi:hypothetical protein
MNRSFHRSGPGAVERPRRALELEASPPLSAQTFSIEVSCQQNVASKR